MKQSFVTFYSPGTIVAETTTQPIDSWDVDEAISMSKEIKERHGALPYGFCFTVREKCTEAELDSKEVERSHMYYLGGEIVTLKDLKKKNDPADKIRIYNMERNGCDKIITNNNSWKWTQLNSWKWTHLLKEGDIILSI